MFRRTIPKYKMPWRLRIRITSYNVCYTKLLRDVVATKDGTIVEFTTKQTVTDRNGNTYVAGSTNTVKLNTGQTFAIENADLNKSTSLAGMYVRSVDAAGNPDPSKPIAVTISDDSVHDKNVGSGAYDLIGDQIIPLPYLGSYNFV